MSFCRGILFVGGFWRSRALLAVVLWLGGLFYGGMSLLCRCLRALCVVSLGSFFYLSFYRCLAVAGFAFVVCGGFCALSGCFWRRFAFFSISVLIVAFCRWFVFFCANFSSLLMPVFIFFSAVECCLLAICVFTFPHYKLEFPSAWCFHRWRFFFLLTLFLPPCLSNAKSTGGLARAGAARRRWKSGFWACGAFWRLSFAVGGLMVFFLSGRPLF